MKKIVYDIEVLPNLFLAVFIDLETDKEVVCEISNRKNDIKLLLKILKNYTLIGYNNHHYDDVVCSYIMNTPVKKLTNYNIYRISKAIINNEKEIYSKYTNNKKIDSIDLMTMLASSALRVSLKHLQVITQWEKVQEFEVDWDSELDESQFDECIEYCKNDVRSTKHVCTLKSKDFANRERINTLSKEDTRSMDGVNIGVSLLMQEYSQKTGHDKFTERGIFRNVRPATMPNYYTYIDMGNLEFKDCIFPNIEFKTPHFQKVLKSYQDMTFEHFNKLPKIRKYVHRLIHPKGLVCNYGVGGTHADRGKSEIITPPEGWVFTSVDVNSFYPSIIDKYNLCPPHLKMEWNEIYSNKREERIKAKFAGDEFTAELNKLSLNAVFGQLNSIFSPVYSPKSFYQVTINGQLLLSMLMERFIMAGFTPISMNTDSVEILYPRDKQDEFEAIKQQWEIDTKMTLDQEYYTKMIRRDINSYMAIKCDIDGNLKYKNNVLQVKKKGFFEEELNLLKGYRYPVVKKALFEYFVNGKSVDEYIRNHDNIYDFCISVKMGKSNVTGRPYKAILNNTILNKTNRFYASSKGSHMYKTCDFVTMEHVLKDSPIQLFNDYVYKDDYEINYSYYIKECKSIINIIEPSMVSLF